MEAENLKRPRSPIAALIDLIEQLRGENGCPWDRRQTARSMAVYLVEEVFELTEAIESGNETLVCEEAGDVLFQLLFIVWLYQEQAHFTLEDVVGGILEKMIRRHPHVFGNRKVSDSEAVRRQWREIKQDEKGGPLSSSVLDGIPSGLPALHRAYRISERAAGTGFDWQDMAGVMDKTMEEWDEFREEWRRCKRDPAQISEHLALEFGDLLFTLTNVARFGGFHPESALARATGKFEKRFRAMEESFRAAGRDLQTVSFDEMEAAWQKVKSEIG
jgi:MazG family protein